MTKLRAGLFSSDGVQFYMGAKYDPLLCGIFICHLESAKLKRL